MSLVLAEKIFSLLLIVAMGFGIVRSGVMKADQSVGISLAVLYIISPCMIVSAFQVDLTPDVVNGFLLALAAAAIIQGLFILLSELVLGKLLHFGVVDRTSISYSNAGNLILPLVLMMFGEDMVIYCTPYFVIQTVLFWTHLRSAFEGKRAIGVRQILLNVNMIAVYLGIFLFVTGLRLPDPVEVAVDSVGQMIGPAAMLVAGMIMGGMDLKRLFSFKRLPVPVLGRMVVFPLIAVAILKLTPLHTLVPNGADILLITLLAASAPSASTVCNMAQIYHKNEEYASAINVATLLCCIVTMPLMVAIYQL